MNSGSQQNPFATSSHSMKVGSMASEVQMDFIRKTYILFLAGVLTAIVAGSITLMVEPVTMLAIGIWRLPILAVGLLLGGSVLAQSLAVRPGLDVAALFGFTGLMGFLMSPIIATYAPSAVGQAAVMSAVIFGALTAYVFLTKKDFSFMGGMLAVGMISMIVGLLLNAFWLHSSMTAYFLSWGVLFLSSGFVLFQTSNLVHQYRRDQAGAAALGLFISFYNIFISLLNILGGSRR